MLSEVQLHISEMQEVSPQRLLVTSGKVRFFLIEITLSSTLFVYTILYWP
jgi:hypothetical protein